MKLALKPEMFVNNKFYVSYGNREALFTIVDEEFAGNNRLGRINMITILVRKLDNFGNELGAQLCTSVIALGDGVVNIRSDNPELRGKLLNKDNMEQCLVELCEDG